MDAVTLFLRVAARLRSWGVEVHEVPGWQTRGSGPLRIAAWLWHHTAGSRRGGPTASLRVCTFGRAGLRNSLCAWYVPRIARGQRLRCYLVAARASWHAGRGVLVSNGTAGGTESENDGIGEPWTDEEYLVQVLLAAAVTIESGHAVRPDEHHDHLEHAPGRKSDRKVAGAFRGAARFRADVAAVVRNGGPLHQPKPAPDDDQDDDMPAIFTGPDGKQKWLVAGGSRSLLTGPDYADAKQAGIPERGRFRDWGVLNRLEDYGPPRPSGKRY